MSYYRTAQLALLLGPEEGGAGGSWQQQHGGGGGEGGDESEEGREAGPRRCAEAGAGLLALVPTEGMAMTEVGGSVHMAAAAAAAAEAAAVAAACGSGDAAALAASSGIAQVSWTSALVAGN